mgnify:CR=1 FL=1|tara:strand:- start:1583 stop:1912 length:330 start_codon:yes stop_codon:yes gene_type:complete
MSLYENINKRKKLGISRSKKKSTISPESYANMKAGFPKKMKGGKLEGPSHKEGGIPIEVEGGEYIIKKNSVTDKTLPILQEINNTGQYTGADKNYDFPVFDARERSEKK